LDLLRHAGFLLDVRAATAVTAKVGAIRRVEEITDGVVHLVARVRGEAGSVVLKHRGPTCRRIPTAAMCPDDIAAEAQALRLVAQTAPAAVPALLAADVTHHTLVLEDVAAPDLTPGTLYVSTVDAAAAIAALTDVAATVAMIHQTTPVQALRHDGDDAFLQRNLFERVTYHATAATTRLAAQLTRQDRALLLGDLSPKNMLLGRRRSVLFDLEHAHRGPRAFDVAFLVAHVLLHRLALDTPTQAVTLSSTVTAAYDDVYPLDPESRATLGRLVAALMAYRLRNPVVPYPLPFATALRDALATTALQVVAGPNVPLEAVVARLYAVFRRSLGSTR
jgi:fructosamine-3-kinase